MNLFDLTNASLDLRNLADCEELDEQTRFALRGQLQRADGEWESKAESYASIIREIEARADARNAESLRISALAASDSARALALKGILMEAMEYLGKPKLETTRFRISIVGNGGKQPITMLDDNIPAEFMRVPEPVPVEPVPDMVRIREALEGGELLDFARLEPRGKRLSIR